MSIDLRHAEPEFPLRDGVEVFRVKSAARGTNDNPWFRHEFGVYFDVAFGDGDAVGCEPLPVLRELVEHAASVVDRIEIALDA